MTDRIFNVAVIRTLVVLTGCLVLGQYFLVVTSFALPLALVFIAGSAVAFFLLPERALMPLYFCYLICEGALKILSNYNPVIHVASDLILIGVFWRLFQRKRAGASVGTHNEGVREDLRTAVVFFLLYWIWVAVQFFNPLNLGLLPSLAGLKLHLIPYLCFFIICFYLKKEEVAQIPFVLFVIIFAEAIWSIIDWSQGVQFIGRLSYGYVRTYNMFLNGYPYRPFGTTALPGQPGVWIANGVVALFLVHYKLTQMTPEQAAQSMWYRFRNLLWLYLPVAILGLVVCQVRVTLIRTILVICVGISLKGRKYFSLVVLAGVLATIWNLHQPPPPPFSLNANNSSVLERLGMAFLRFRTLQSKDTYVRARGGTAAFEEILRRGSVNSMGYGLSRISASSAPWTHLIKVDRYFPAEWVFADNLLVAIFTELGLFGMAAYVAMFIAFVVILIRREGTTARFVAAVFFLSFLSGYASEGMLYQPEASTLWTILAIGMRSEGAA